jgi:peroxiredoxin
VDGAGKMVARQIKEQGGTPGFPLLADPDHRVIARYGQLNPALFKNQSNPDGYIVPHPATFVIDKQGRVTWKFTNVDAQIRPTNDQIVAALMIQQGK